MSHGWYPQLCSTFPLSGSKGFYKLMDMSEQLNIEIVWFYSLKQILQINQYQVNS